MKAAKIGGNGENQSIERMKYRNDESRAKNNEENGVINSESNS
jgi:hypothetical protein